MYSRWMLSCGSYCVRTKRRLMVCALAQHKFGGVVDTRCGATHHMQGRRRPRGIHAPSTSPLPSRDSATFQHPEKDSKLRSSGTRASGRRWWRSLLQPPSSSGHLRRRVQRERSPPPLCCRFWVEMEVVLQARDAKDWVYKGEGAANLILSYTGSSPSMLGKVLRVKKILKDKSQPAPNCIVFSSYEQLLWGEIPELVESVKQDCLAQAYAIHVMSQHLGANHVDGGVRVHVSRDFLELVQKNVLSNRPAWRVNASSIDTNADSALLISDHSLFSGNPRGSNCIAVEIKAKCGFLSSSEYVSKENSIKKQVTRYKMHQHLKFHQGEVSRISEYDPLDLFSGSKERIRMGIKSFFSTPQNNFRIFVNGSLVFGGMGGGADSVHPNETEKCLEDLSKVSGLQISDFIDLLSEAIFKSGVLGKLLAAQKLDDHDIEGAIHLYYNIISQPCLVCKDITDAELLRKYTILHSLSLENSQKIVRDFLISATAKDCSLMISFRPRESRTTDSEYDSVFLESVNRIYDYKAYFVDLDVKPLDKMVHYFKLDQKIVDFYTRSGEVGRDPCDSPQGGGDSDDTKIQLQH